MDRPKAVHCPANVSDLLYDTACLQVVNNLDSAVDLFTVSSECIQCDALFWTTVPLQASVSLVVPAVHSVGLTAHRQDDQEVLCEQTLSLAQHERVNLSIKECTFTVEDKGDDAYMPLYVFTALLVSLLVLIAAARAVHRSRYIQNLLCRNPTIIDMQNDLGYPNSSTDSLPLVQSELVPLRRLSTPRVQALDTFRGLTIALMIFVNYGGGQYSIFKHSAWNGLTVADMVYPWFAWVMGVSLVLSYRSKLRSCVSRWQVLQVSLHRTLVLVTLGLLVNMYNQDDISTARYCGVLQRLGMAHLIIAVLEIAFMKKQPSFQHGRWMCMFELKDSACQWLIVLVLAALQVSVSLYWPVPDCPTGYLGPGGRANHSEAPHCTGGVARYIDVTVFGGEKHLYSHGPVKKVYDTTVAFDPEGLLGTLTTCVTVYLGALAGYIILCYNSTKDRCVHWIMWAVTSGVIAGFLCDWSQEGGLIPVNKQLWSLSFALLTSAAGFFLFTILFVVIDHFHWWSGNPFNMAGMNAILLYVGHIVTRQTFPWSWKTYSVTTHEELLVMNVGAVALWLLIAVVLHRNNVIFSV